ncbi:hypothetical protein CRM22_000045 [Opisthorchis felineus]|uniref:Uncharacterized protein n=1 Tax=Opisthorchis felineus TaxID=147828 RepID=A0A4S2MGV0_OPIFE|nr:hypothetical protein CRM22_000045 [Opisthorchis felineus]
MTILDVPEVTLRLRHLNGIKGRGFAVNKELTDLSGVMFAISLLGPENFGYFYMSRVCENVNYPEWDTPDLSDCQRWILASKGAVFTFFAVQGHTNTMLFEMTVHFSGLVGIDAEVHAAHSTLTPVNEVYFQFSGVLYSPPNYLQQTTCSMQCVRPRHIFRVSPKLSYDFEELQRFIVNAEVMHHQTSRMKTMMQSMNMLQTSLSGILNLSAKREAGLVELDLMKCRLRAAKADVEELRSRLGQLSDQRSLVEDMLEHIACGRAVISERISTVSRATSRTGSYMMKLDRAISFRISQLIHQLVEIFGTELGALDPKNTVSPDTMTEDVTRPIIFVPLSPSHLNLDYPNSAIVRQHTTETVIADHSLSTNQTVNVVANGSGTKSVNSVESDFVLAASKLGMIAQLLRFVAAVLSHPLRHPLDLTEGTSRAKVTDYLAQELVEGEPNFPLYLSRSSLLPAYKHAVSLLNRDLADLRAFVGLSTSVEETTTWNLRTFLQHCLSEKGHKEHEVNL